MLRRAAAIAAFAALGCCAGACASASTPTEGDADSCRYLAFMAELAPEERERSEQTLLRHYLDCLRALGVTPPDFDQAWDDYRANMVYGSYMWAITRLVEPRITHEFVRRLGLAVTALDSYALLGLN